MNNWRDIKKEVPDCSKLKSAIIRVKYIYYIASTPSWATFPSCLGPMINETLPSKPFAVSLSPHLGIGTIHIDPPRFDDNGVDLLSGGYRFSDLKGEYQTLTHWMYLDDPYDESEENVDGQLLMDYDGKVKEPTSVKILEFDKPNKMRRKYDSKNIASIINKDQRFKKENNMKFVKTVTNHVFDLSQFEIGAVYSCTPHDISKNSFVGIYKEGGPTIITFWVPSGTKTLSVDDVMNDWVIEKMIEPMTDDELRLLCDIFTHFALSEEVNEIQKDTIRSIQKKLGFTVEE